MAAKPVDDGDYKMDRFIALRGWFGRIGCCWSCQDVLAWTQVDRENGCAASADLADCKNGDKGDLCRARANANRKAMPVRP